MTFLYSEQCPVYACIDASATWNWCVAWYSSCSALTHVRYTFLQKTLSMPSFLVAEIFSDQSSTTRVYRIARTGEGCTMTVRGPFCRVGQRCAKGSSSGHASSHCDRSTSSAGIHTRCSGCGVAARPHNLHQHRPQQPRQPQCCTHTSRTDKSTHPDPDACADTSKHTSRCNKSWTALSSSASASATPHPGAHGP